MGKNFFQLKQVVAEHKISFAISCACVVLIFAILFSLIFFTLNLPSDTKPNTKPQSETERESVVNSALTKEVRGVYIASVHNINFPSSSGKSAEALRSELDAIINKCVETGFNTIYFQVRPSADALYESDVFPTSRFIVKNEGDPLPLDPLSYLVEKAGEKGIDVVAWVNPYRVTSAEFDTKEEALDSLSNQNIAKENPDWTFLYDGKLYFNPGAPQVRDLVTQGVKELCTGYNIAGILYDDYFYPYPVDGETIDDADTYHQSGTKLSLSDWRRENVNLMVKESYETVKSVSEDLTFGVSPFGIWQNVSSNSEGSDTAGLESYLALYCDTLAWVKGGYVDYVSPQLYWSADFTVASFDVLASWWNEKLLGTGVKLVISHGAYRVGEYENGSLEISEQIISSSQYPSSFGSIQYGYADIRTNNYGVKDAITEAFSQIDK